MARIQASHYGGVNNIQQPIQQLVQQPVHVHHLQPVFQQNQIVE